MCWLLLGDLANEVLKSFLPVQTSDLMPANDPRVVEYNKILDEFVTATNLVIVVQGEEKRIKAFADGLAPRILELKDGGSNAIHRS